LNCDPTRVVFEEVLQRVRRKHDLYLCGYVLMPEHVHLLVSEPKRQPLATTMRVRSVRVKRLLNLSHRAGIQEEEHEQDACFLGIQFI
jgi:putative transposase